MVLDKLSEASKYYSLHPKFKIAFEYIFSHDFKSISGGSKIVVDDDVLINVDEPTLRAKEEALPEAHDKHIDIQVPIVGEETCGFIPRSKCHTVDRQDAEKDYLIYKEMPTGYFSLTPEDFVIFFPSDGHAPIIGSGYEKKIVVKIRL
jgi:YhcH/YjgK/YiaL family protein